MIIQNKIVEKSDFNDNIKRMKEHKNELERENQ